MLRRRDFLIATVAAVSAPRIAAAQQASGAPRIGFLFYGSPGPAPEIEAFQKGLTDAGYFEAQNIAVDYRFADGRPERLPELARQLAAFDPPMRLHTSATQRETTQESKAHIRRCIARLVYRRRPSLLIIP